MQDNIVASIPTEKRTVTPLVSGKRIDPVLNSQLICMDRNVLGKTYYLLGTKAEDDA